MNNTRHNFECAFPHMNFARDGAKYGNAETQSMWEAFSAGANSGDDTYRWDAIERSLSSLQFNAIKGRWTVQLPGQVIGCIGVGGTARAAIDNAIQRDLESIAKEGP